MSHIGRQPIEIPDGVEVSLKSEEISVKGPKGSLSQNLSPLVKVEQKEKELIVSPADEKQNTPMWGTTRALINNMIIGVSKGFEKHLEIHGVGYKAQVQGKSIELNVGYSHPIKLDIPEGLEVKVEKNNITISGINKETIGALASSIRATRKPEPYKGKGIRYKDEYVRRKEGKRVVSEEGGGE